MFLAQWRDTIATPIPDVHYAELVSWRPAEPTPANASIAGKNSATTVPVTESLPVSLHRRHGKAPPTEPYQRQAALSLTIFSNSVKRGNNGNRRNAKILPVPTMLHESIHAKSQLG